VETDEFNKIISDLKESAKIYQHEVELRVLDKCPFIVEVGAMTVGMDETGKVITQNVRYPTQFAQKAVDEILRMKFWNGLNEVAVPKVYGRSDWYLEQLNNISEAIKILEVHVTQVESGLA
jgi:hypothetical protein